MTADQPTITVHRASILVSVAEDSITIITTSVIMATVIMATSAAITTATITTNALASP